MTFRPMPILTLCSAISVAILIMLGNWQWGRFQEKMALDLVEPAWTTIDGSVIAGSEASVYSYIDGQSAWRRVVAIDTGDTVVFTPIEVLFQIEPPAQPDGPIRSEALHYAARGLYRTPKGRNAFTTVDQPGAAIFNTMDPEAMKTLLPPEAAARVSAEIFEPATIQLTENGRSGAGDNPFARVRMDDKLPPQRHFGYAITWWGLAMALIGVYLALHYQQGRLRFRKRQDET